MEDEDDVDEEIAGLQVIKFLFKIVYTLFTKCVNNQFPKEQV